MSQIYNVLMHNVDPVALKRAQDEIVEDERRNKRQTAAPIRRGMGFANMLEASRRGTFDEDESVTLEERPHVRRGMGFANMLEGAAKGTE